MGTTVEDFKQEVDEAVAADEAMPEPTEPADEPDAFDDAPEGDNKDYPGAAKLINEIEAQQAKIDKINEQAKKDKEPYQTEMSVLKKRVKDETGMETAVLNFKVAERKQKRRLEERRNGLDEIQTHQLKQLEMAM